MMEQMTMRLIARDLYLEDGTPKEISERYNVDVEDVLEVEEAEFPIIFFRKLIK